MQALILAAGCGKRLRPLTDNTHKSLVEVNGIPLLVNALNCLSGRDIDEVLIVVGDKKELIIERIGHIYNGMKITYIENPLYEVTNNVYSLWLARPYLHSDLLMAECDLFYGRTLIDKILLDRSADCTLLVSPFKSEIMDGTVVTTDSNNNVTSLIIKRDQPVDMDYSDKAKTVNIYFLQKDFVINCFMPMLSAYVETQRVDSYYELVLGTLIYWKNQSIKAVYVESFEWCEIDDMEDLKRVEKKFEK